MKSKNKEGGKRGFALFPWLIIIVALVIFNIASFILLEKTKEKIKSIENLDEVIDYSWFIKNYERFLNLSYELAYAQALNDLSHMPSFDCEIIQISGETFFSLEKCKLDQDLFLNNFKQRFNEHINSFSTLTNAKSECNFDNNKVDCQLTFNKTFELNFLNLTTKKVVKFERAIDLSYINNLEEARKEVLEKIKAIKIAETEQSIPKKYSIKIELISGRQKITFLTKKFFLVENDKVLYKEIPLIFIY
ncbi:MAG: hypothetical protein QW244_01675 [Candidatus Pacearchaeota archaeon]